MAGPDGVGAISGGGTVGTVVADAGPAVTVARARRPLPAAAIRPRIRTARRSTPPSSNHSSVFPHGHHSEALGHGASPRWGTSTRDTPADVVNYDAGRPKVPHDGLGRVPLTQKEG